MDSDTFLENFNQRNWLRGTYLCHEVELQEGDSWTPVDEFKGFLSNQLGLHAEEDFLELIRSWQLNKDQQYRVTWYTSWSPCVECVKQVLSFLEENKNVKLRIFAARLYYANEPPYQQGLRSLKQAGVQLEVMSFREFRYCWQTFVAHQGTPFPPWDKLQEHSERLAQQLTSILQLPPSQLPALTAALSSQNQGD